MPSTSPKPGQIWKVDLGYEGKVRWFVVVSRFDPDAARALALAVPVTTLYRESAYEVPLGKLPCFREPSFANVQGLTSLRWTDFQEFGGQVPAPLMEQIRKAMRHAMEF
jgi:mRNA interferase MazF